ncbi:type I glutamate--ammonia ligase [Sedimentibacter sp. zth1]|uniref:type I glutamate--ammonia ligase n=1 Tax=Sedimentibacter sp. zth1 TaxID=2816908 RepID=UPI001A912440|nr:type I glutamate--ammonia ligase [Sedimentibacter sp. zth1]QSX07069.1 type I glutamate--ammonia ligase [Sedimentibacter sp. zth1]
MFKNINDMIKYCKNEKIEVIDFKVVDLSGRWHRLSITSQKLTEDIMNKGIGFDGSSYGFLTVEKSDMVMMPDLSTAYIDSYKKYKTLVVIADIYKIVNGKLERFEDDPRYIAEKTEIYMAKNNIADKCLLGPEFEFYVLDHASYENLDNHMEVLLDSKQAKWNMGKKDTQNLGFKVEEDAAYHLDSPFDAGYDFRTEACVEAEKVNIPIKYCHAENGGPGQAEIELNFAGVKEMGDRTMKLKNLLNNCAVKHNKTVTFMPKPFANECGSSQHIHIQLKNGENYIFFEKGGYSDLSDTALYAIAGILKHLKALTAIANPSTNSYRRLVPGYEAPLNICFGASNRSASIRVPGYTIEPDEKRFELRSPDGTCNPYLTYAAVMMAAFDGIINKLDYKEFGPMDANLYKLSKEELEKMASLPTSLLDAANELEKDHEFLLIGDVFTENIIKNHINKIKNDFYEVNRMPHPEEFIKYYNC